MLSKPEAGQIAARQRVRLGISWAQVAEHIDKPPVWAVAAVLGQHPLTAPDAAALATLLELDAEVVEALQLQPYRGPVEGALADPTIYRFHEALMVYGPALKELIHEQFGDGIMSAINFNLEIARDPDAAEDRVQVIFNGKFLPYAW